MKYDNTVICTEHVPTESRLCRCFESQRKILIVRRSYLKMTSLIELCPQVAEMAVVLEACGKAFLWFVVRAYLQGPVFVEPPFFRLLVKMSWLISVSCTPGSSVGRCSILDFHSYREMDYVNTGFYCVLRHFGTSNSCSHFAEQSAAEGLAKVNF